MDFKRNEIRKIIISIISLLVLLILLFYCFIPSEEQKRPLVKSIILDEKYLLTIVLDNLNSKKRIGNVDNIELNGVVRLGVDKVKEAESEVILLTDVINCRDCFYDNEKYRFNVEWPGGRVLIWSIYKDGEFTVLDESYLKRR